MEKLNYMVGGCLTLELFLKVIEPCYSSISKVYKFFVNTLYGLLIFAILIDV